jgi:hypothetical protein
VFTVSATGLDPGDALQKKSRNPRNLIKVLAGLLIKRIGAGISA